jgi:hypothetical protein
MAGPEDDLEASLDGVQRRHRNTLAEHIQSLEAVDMEGEVLVQSHGIASRLDGLLRVS